MANRSLNKALLIGNLTRDPELRYTPNGTAVCSFGLATNRFWTTDTGEKREDTEFHRIVAWNKLAEICSQLCTKGRKVFVEGRLSTRSWTAQDGTQRTVTEIVIEDMILLDSKRPTVEAAEEVPSEKKAEEESEKEPSSVEEVPAEEKEKKKARGTTKKASSSDDVSPEDIPF